MPMPRLREELLRLLDIEHVVERQSKRASPGDWKA
jgi:hypothetical protein